MQDGANPIDASALNGFIRVWDMYDSIGWKGPDGEGTPSLLLMNYVDVTGAPILNAVYASKEGGFQVFRWTRQAGDLAAERLPNAGRDAAMGHGAERIRPVREPLKAAIAEAKFTVTEDPNTTVEGCSPVSFDFAQVKEAAEKGVASIGFYKAPDANPLMRVESWPVTGTTVAKMNLHIDPPT